MKYYLMRKKKSNANGKVLLGALAGAAFGFTAGLLTAPRSGKETREVLSTRTSETLDKVGKTLADSADAAMKTGKGEVDKIADKLSS